MNQAVMTPDVQPEMVAEYAETQVQTAAGEVVAPGAPETIYALASEIREAEGLFAVLADQVDQATDKACAKIAELHAPIQERLDALEAERLKLLEPYAEQIQEIEGQVYLLTEECRAAGERNRILVREKREQLVAEMRAYAKAKGAKTCPGEISVTLSETRKLTVLSEERATATIVANAPPARLHSLLAPNAAGEKLIEALSSYKTLATEEEAKEALDAFPGFDLTVDRKVTIKAAPKPEASE